nr:uncharacterized protein LOC105470735 [Macaca nemestrina]
MEPHCGHSVNDSTTGVSLGASLEEGDHRDISDRRDGIQALLTQRTDEPRCRKARLPSGEFLLANGRPQSESAPGQAPVPPALRSVAGPGLQQPYQPLQLTGGSGSLQLRFLSRSVLPIRYGLCLHHRLCNPFPVGESLLQRSEVSVFRLNLTRGKALTARWQVTSAAGRPGLPYLQTEAPRPAEGRGRAGITSCAKEHLMKDYMKVEHYFLFVGHSGSSRQPADALMPCVHLSHPWHWPPLIPE